MSMIQTDEHIEKQPSYIPKLKCYVKLVRLSKEDIERHMGRNHKKKNTPKLVNKLNTPNGLIKQEHVEDTMEIYETTIEHTSSQSTVQAYGINVKIEPTDVIEVKTEQENRIRTITEGSTAFSNYTENVNGNEFICQICHGNFDNYEEYIIHKNLIHKSKPFVCKVCNVHFVLNAHLNIHLAEHDDKVNFNRSHKCKDCNKYFTTRDKLNIHYKQHRQQMICKICHKKFLLKKNFEKHLLSHTNVIISNGISNDTSFNESNSLQNQNAIKIEGDKSKNQIISKHEKLFHCSYCNNNYKSKQSLSQHNRHHHSHFKLPRRNLKSKTVECNYCSLVITKCNLLRHIKSLHPKINPIQCLRCPMAFKDSLSLKLHVSRCHKA